MLDEARPVHLVTLTPPVPGFSLKLSGALGRLHAPGGEDGGWAWGLQVPWAVWDPGPPCRHMQPPGTYAHQQEAELPLLGALCQHGRWACVSAAKGPQLGSIRVSICLSPYVPGPKENNSVFTYLPSLTTYRSLRGEGKSRHGFLYHSPPPTPSQWGRRGVRVTGMGPDPEIERHRWPSAKIGIDLQRIANSCDSLAESYCIGRLYMCSSDFNLYEIKIRVQIESRVLCIYTCRRLPFSFLCVLWVYVGVKIPAHSKVCRSLLSNLNQNFPSLTVNNMLADSTESAIFIFFTWRSLWTEQAINLKPPIF